MTADSPYTPHSFPWNKQVKKDGCLWQAPSFCMKSAVICYPNSVHHTRFGIPVSGTGIKEHDSVRTEIFAHHFFYNDL